MGNNEAVTCQHPSRQLNVEQIKAWRGFLEGEITVCVGKFEKGTGCKVKDVQISRIDVSTFNKVETLLKVVVDVGL